MAAVSLSAQNNRLDHADDNAGWESIGGGQAPSSEGSFRYQGTALVNKKITSTGGVAYDPTNDAKAAEDMTAPGNETFMLKGLVADYGGLNAVLGCAARIGSSSSAYHQINVAGSGSALSAYSKYAARDRFIIVPVNPAIAGYRTTQGSPNLGLASYFGFYVDFDASTAKAENVGLDAIDLGTGLTLVGGDGADTDGNFNDFVDYDEGTPANRFGYASSIYNGAVVIAFGRFKIGDGVTATSFTDNSAQVTWPDGFFDAGFSGPYFDVPAGSSAVDGANHSGLGDLTVVDTRPDYDVVSAGNHTHTGTLKNFRNVNYNGNTTVTNTASISGVKTVNQNGADISGLNVSDGDSGQTAVIRSATGIYSDGSVSNSDRGMNITAIITGASGSRQATIDGTQFSGNVVDITLSDAETVTVNLINGASASTIENTGAGGAVINNPKSISITGIPAGLEARARRGSKTLIHAPDVQSGSFTYSYNFSGSELPVVISVGGVADDSTPYIRKEFSLQEKNSDQSIPADLAKNPSYQ